MARALGIISFSENHIWVEGMETYRSIPAFSFLGRYRVIDFPISNMSNSGIDRIQVYIRRKPCSLVEHIGRGRHYNINSKSGYLQMVLRILRRIKTITTRTSRLMQRIWTVW